MDEPSRQRILMHCEVNKDNIHVYFTHKLKRTEDINNFSCLDHTINTARHQLDPVHVHATTFISFLETFFSS